METPRAITKVLLPGLRANLLHRPRLVDFLHGHIERKLLLVSASAGYGKTSLLIDFAHDTPLPVCWYSLDPSDADPKTFLEYLLASLRRQFPNFGAKTYSLLSDPAMLRDVQVVVGTLVTEIYETIPGFFVLILDDFHTVEESDEINHIVDTLLRLLPESAHLILSSRTLPSKLTLTRLTARQEIAGLGVSDLRFTANEIQTFIRQNYQIEFTEQEAAQLAEHSEGWITGILLTTNTLWQGLFQNLVRLQGTHSHIFNYLASEVLALQTPEVQQFLLDSSIFEELDPAACNQLFNITNAAGVLRIIEQKNLFVVRLEETNGLYRYHHLFQEFLQARLMESDIPRWLDLNSRAARLFEERGHWAPAISHYLKAKAFDEAARVIEQIAKETFDAGRWVTLAKWIDALPVVKINEQPDLLIYRARVSDEMGDRVRAIETYSRALEIYEQSGDTSGTARALVMQASCWRVQGRYQEAIDNCERALTLAGKEGQRERADAYRILGICQGRMGNWQQCIVDLELALRVNESLADLSRIALLHHDLGNAFHTAGHPDSQKHFQQALDYWRRANNSSGLANTLNSVGVGFHQNGQSTQAIEALEHALIEAKRCGQLRIEALTLASLGDVHRDLGEYARAQQFYQTAYDIGKQINEGFVITYTLSALGEMYRLLGDLNAAQQLGQHALEQAGSHHSNYEVGLAEIARGALRYAQGDSRAATESLEHAIELLERGGAKREIARARLLLAQVNFAQRKYRLAGEHLNFTAELGKQLGEDQFAIADGKQLLPVVRYALSKKIEVDFFTHLMKKIESQGVVRPDKSNDEEHRSPRFQVEARAFGTASVSVNGRLVSKTDWDSVAAKELFFFLVANPQGQSKEHILTTLWSDISPAKANGIFHSTTYRMRRALTPDCLIYENGLYRINPALELWYDVSAFDSLMAEAERASTRDRRAQCWREAAELYHGDYLEDSYSDWCISIRAQLQNRYLDILAGLADLYDREAKPAEAIALYQRILAKDSLREDTYRTVMHLQVKSGDRGAALKTYQLCVQALQDELGVAPDLETQRLFEQISKSASSSN